MPFVASGVRNGCNNKNHEKKLSEITARLPIRNWQMDSGAAFASSSEIVMGYEEANCQSAAK